MNGKMRLFGMILAAIVVAGTLQSVWGQAAAPASAAPAVGEVTSTEQDVTIRDLWVTGGWCMYPIGVLNIAGLAYIIYGFMLIGDKRMMQTTLVPPVQEAMSRLDFHGAGALCSGAPGVFSNILNAGLIRAGATLDAESAENAMSEAAVEENVAGLRPINYLSIIASIAPMFGLLGTVSGMIKAFQKIGLGGMGKPEQLAANIGEAMITTAYGLIVGIPAMMFYFYLKSRWQQNMAAIARTLGHQTHQMKEIRQRVADGDLSLDQMTAAVPTAVAAVPAAPAAGQ
jgi:biopolymer transport protein ExbB